MEARAEASRAALTAALAAAALCAASCATRGGVSRLGVRADVLEPARTVATPDGALAVYELQIRNESESPVRIARLTRTRSDRPGEEDVAGDALARRVVLRRRAADPAERLHLGPGERAVVLLDAAFPRGAAPPAFEHGLTIEAAGERGGTSRDDVTASERAPDPAAACTLSPPLAGPGWLVENGPATLSGHRRAVVWLRAAPRAAQRFAVDFFRVDAEGRTSAGDPQRNASHPGFGADVLAVADAVVADAADGIPDNVPDPTKRAVEMTGETLAGNHVVLDLGAGRFAMYAHLQQGSVAVRKGDRVRRGDVLGRLGNSGNSTEPHLHFHVADGPSPVDASGLPFVLDGFSCRGAQISGVLPAEGSVVDFDRDASHATIGAPSDSATK